MVQQAFALLTDLTHCYPWLATPRNRGALGLSDVGVW